MTLGLAGVLTSVSGTWLSVLDIVLGVGAIVDAITLNPRSQGDRILGGPSLITVSLFVLSIVGFYRAAAWWVLWGTFALAFAFLALAIQIAATREWDWVGVPPNSTQTKESESERQQEIA